MRVMTEGRRSGIGVRGNPRSRRTETLDPRSSLLAFRALYEKRCEQRDGPPGRSFFLARFPRRPGNIEVGPLVLARESRKEAGGGDTTRSASADICKIGEVAFQLFLIILPQRQPPYRVARLHPRCLQLVCQVIFVGD